MLATRKMVILSYKAPEKPFSRKKMIFTGYLYFRQLLLLDAKH
jgi:hypothetical protein